MKRIIYLSLSILALASCQKHMTDLNIDPKNPTVVPSSTLMTKAQVNLANNLASADVNVNIFRLISQYWTETTYTDESNYNFAERSIPDNWWNAWYRDVLNNLQQARIFARTDVTAVDPGVLKNDSAIIDIQQCYAFYVLLTTYGNVPYTQALDPNVTFPKYDDAKTAYYDILSRLDADIAALDPNSASWGGADVIYNGDPAAWKKFAYSLELKMGVLIADDDPARAKTVVEAAAPNVFTSNDDNASLPFLQAPPNTNPIWVSLVQSGRQDFVATTTIINIMDSLNDPRIADFFTEDGNDSYSGGVPGKSNTYSSFSHAGSAIVKPDFPGLILDYAEVELALAEGAARGFNVGGTVETHYDAAITASITYWGGSATDATTFLAQPTVNYATAGGTWQQKIGLQSYLALYNRGFEGWTAIRHLNYPSLPAPKNALSVFPQRVLYPTKEENANTGSWQTAANAIGGDNVGTKLWFDKN
ncbi:SusD/RagB family nutrient-binding outer membrane lipoprotein [Puia sp.]|uniref:SusD/RagB family nutrient-binding outer membrane lipoprotein n=1 Tax=Puia sp. TaxID=2045100 RepID=UPI002F417144